MIRATLAQESAARLAGAVRNLRASLRLRRARDRLAARRGPRRAGLRHLRHRRRLADPDPNVSTAVVAAPKTASGAGHEPLRPEPRDRAPRPRHLRRGAPADVEPDRLLLSGPRGARFAFRRGGATGHGARPGRGRGRGDLGAPDPRADGHAPRGRRDRARTASRGASACASAPGRVVVVPDGYEPLALDPLGSMRDRGRRRGADAPARRYGVRAAGENATRPWRSLAAALARGRPGAQDRRTGRARPAPRAESGAPLAAVRQASDPCLRGTTRDAPTRSWRGSDVHGRGAASRCPAVARVVAPRPGAGPDGPVACALDAGGGR